MDFCLECNLVVSDDDLSVSCDACRRWCHIECGSGLTDSRYYEIIENNGGVFRWTCKACIEIADRQPPQFYGETRDRRIAVANNTVRVVEAIPAAPVPEEETFKILPSASRKGGVSIYIYHILCFAIIFYSFL